MTRNTRNYPQSEEDEQKETIRKLKAQLKRVKKQNIELKSENKSLKKAWNKTEKFLSEALDDVPLEEVLKYNKLPKKALRKRAKQEKKKQKETAKEYFRRWRKENLS